MASHQSSLLTQSNDQFHNALSQSASVILSNPLSDDTKKRQTALLIAAAVTWADSVSAVRITNFKIPVIDMTVSINGKGMGIVVAAVTACLLLFFAVQALLELGARSFSLEQFFLGWKELFDAHSGIVSQYFAFDDEMREIWAQEEASLTQYRLNYSYLNDRLSRVMRRAPRLAEPRSASEAEQWLQTVLSYCNELHRAFQDLRDLEAAEQRRRQSPDVTARNARFHELSELKRELFRDHTISSRVERVLSTMRTASNYNTTREFIELAIPVAFGAVSILVFISRL